VISLVYREGVNGEKSRVSTREPTGCGFLQSLMKSVVSLDDTERRKVVFPVTVTRSKASRVHARRHGQMRNYPYVLQQLRVLGCGVWLPAIEQID
jgi:hypothetical protein